MTCGLEENCQKTNGTRDPTLIWNYIAEILNNELWGRFFYPFLSSRPNFSSGWDPNLVPHPTPTTLTVLGPDGFTAGKKHHRPKFHSSVFLAPLPL